MAAVELDAGHCLADAQGTFARVEPSPPTPAIGLSQTKAGPSALADVLLATFAAALDDLERTRIASANRVRAMVDDHGLPEASPEVVRMRSLVDQIGALEHQAELDLRRAMRGHPFGPWAKGQRGVGDKQAARLLAAIGDPYIKPAQYIDGELVELARTRRGPAELWAYCGYHVLRDQKENAARPSFVVEDPSRHPDQTFRVTRIPPVGVAARRQKGRKANWNAEAKMRARLIAESCLKAGGPFADAYRARRAHTAVTHSDWTPAHSHNDGLRVVAKELLKQLWIEGRRLHEGPP